MELQNLLIIFQTFLAFGNVCIMLYALKCFLARPKDTIEKRINVLEVKCQEMEQSLKQGNDRFRKQDSATEVILHSIVALIDFEIEYCLTEHKVPSDGLKKAKEDLNRFLARK